MLFALFYDKVVWGNTLSAMSWAGSALILGSAIYVAVVRDGGQSGGDAAAGRADEGEGASEGGDRGSKDGGSEGGVGDDERRVNETA